MKKRLILFGLFVVSAAWLLRANISERSENMPANWSLFDLQCHGTDDHFTLVRYDPQVLADKMLIGPEEVGKLGFYGPFALAGEGVRFHRYTKVYAEHDRSIIDWSADLEDFSLYYMVDDSEGLAKVVWVQLTPSLAYSLLEDHGSGVPKSFSDPSLQVSLRLKFSDPIFRYNLESKWDDLKYSMLEFFAFKPSVVPNSVYTADEIDAFRRSLAPFFAGLIMSVKNYGVAKRSISPKAIDPNGRTVAENARINLKTMELIQSERWFEMFRLALPASFYQEIENKNRKEIVSMFAMPTGLVLIALLFLFPQPVVNPYRWLRKERAKALAAKKLQAHRRKSEQGRVRRQQERERKEVQRSKAAAFIDGGKIPVSKPVRAEKKLAPVTVEKIPPPVTQNTPKKSVKITREVERQAVIDDLHSYVGVGCEENDDLRLVLEKCPTLNQMKSLSLLLQCAYETHDEGSDAVCLVLEELAKQTVPKDHLSPETKFFKRVAKGEFAEQTTQEQLV